MPGHSTGCGWPQPFDYPLRGRGRPTGDQQLDQYHPGEPTARIDRAAVDFDPERAEYLQCDHDKNIVSGTPRPARGAPAPSVEAAGSIAVVNVMSFAPEPNGFGVR